ncbi:antibiotic biosynthesis monooxygenase [Streptomyces sp. NPDC048483]|uniref:antibiotic biosynthesis monooxygenase n=1 Tax=Streptomyces sp. NPDC048483 TaxID=3154927 RepID=UPI00341F39AC
MTSQQSTHPSTHSAFLTDVFPQVRRPDAGAVLISEWDAGSPEGRRAVVDGVARAWAETPLPAGFLSRVLFTGTDGTSVLNYAQWTSDTAHREFVRTEDTGLRERIAAVLAGVGDVGNTGPGRFRLYRSLPAEGVPGTPGCVVRVAFRTTGHEAARRLVDGLMDMFGGRQDGEGAFGSHFHISEDGRQVVNYSEWTSAEAHQRQVGSKLQDGGAVMGFLASLEGVEPLGFKRFVTPRGLVRA